ncbi:MAG: alanine--tRNA ligase [Candidatus Latescibacteria bacterium]|nr:alanine--tRNA ligase [Candidatus Latescibacterota bacterium]
MRSHEVRQSFIQFFADRDHEIVPRSSVVPWDDPSLLFTNAGMNQFKDVFLGAGFRPYKRATDAQTVIRAGGKHNDLEDVGKDTYHQTLFEMLGNWSFGDYYKRETITWAWELLTDVWQIPSERLWATVYRDDDEAEELWLECTDIDPAQVLRFDEKDNFWEMGETGPCGPCSEIHYDYGADRCALQNDPDHRCGVNADCGRFMEIWNLVFIQYNRDRAGNLSPLPEKHVDTGMGFERVVAIKQGVASNYDTDLFLPLIAHICDVTGQPYEEESTAVAMRVLADHVRTLTFAISDGALPSNEGRGYVLRRILRRAARFGRTLNQHEPFLYRLVPAVVDVMGAAYPEICDSQERVAKIIKSEEEGFGRTLDRGIELFDDTVESARADDRSEITGKEAFKLYDTYGFPVDLTEVMAEEVGMTVDLLGFDSEMRVQQDRSRSGSSVSLGTNTERPVIPDFATNHSDFVGYSETEVSNSRILAAEGNWVVLTTTPFYAESGGQIGDSGWLIDQGGVKYRIVDTQKQGDTILHMRDSDDGRSLTVDSSVIASVDVERRTAIQRNHTATHLLHAALRNVLGTHVHQTGSLVAEDRLRFDFAHFSPMTDEELIRVERSVNEGIWKDASVNYSTMSLDDAKSAGAMALFGEKYGDEVRVVKIDELSKELCGGTHLRATGETGNFRLVRESSIASGIRRIEAITGEAAYLSAKHDEETLSALSSILKTDREELINRAETLQVKVRELEKEIKRLNSSVAQDWLEDALAQSVSIEGVTVVTSLVDCADAGTLRDMADNLRDRLPGAGIGVLFAVLKDRPMLIVVSTDTAISSRKLTAGELVKDIAGLIGGTGGGKAHLAQAGGKDVSRIREAISIVPEIVKEHLQ